MYTHLRGHSHYSLLEAIGKPSEIVKRAKKLGMGAIAITDYYGLYGAIEFTKAAKKEGIKAIIGVEVGYAKTNEERENDYGNIVLLAKNNDGYSNLLLLVSEGHLEGRNGKKSVITNELLQSYGKNLLCIIGGSESPLGGENHDEIIEGIGKIIGKENIVVEYRITNTDSDGRTETANKKVFQLSRKKGYRIVCSNNFHFIDKDDKKAAEVALHIKDSKRIYDEGKRSFDSLQYICTEHEIRAILKKDEIDEGIIEDMIAETETISNELHVDIQLNQILFPNYQNPDRIKELYEQEKSELIEEL